MQQAIIVRGRLSDSRHIELDEPVSGIQGEVEVLIRPSTAPTAAPTEGTADSDMDVFELLEKLGPGTRTKEDIDRQIREDRESSRD
jgi:hypothetical protein